MVIARFCFCVSLRNGCKAIGILFIYYYFVEMTFHGQNSVFICKCNEGNDLTREIIISQLRITPFKTLYRY